MAFLTLEMKDIWEFEVSEDPEDWEEPSEEQDPDFEDFTLGRRPEPTV